MIPLMADQLLEVRDDHGNIYKFKYLTEIDNQVEYLNLSKTENAERDKFRAKAKADLPKNSGEEKINLRAYELLLEDRRDNPKAHLSLYASYINIFLAGWSGAKLLKYPESKKPASGLRLFEMYKIYRMIQENIAELTGIGFDELKN